MAYVQILGFDVLFFLLSFFVFYRLNQYFSVTHRLLEGLEVVLAPGEESINQIESQLNAKSKRKPSRKRRAVKHRVGEKADTVELKPTVIVVSPKYPLLSLFPNYNELETLVSVFLLGAALFVVSDLMNTMFHFGRQEATTLFLAGIAMLSLFSAAVQIVMSSTSEKSFCFIIGFFSWLLALFVLVGLPPHVTDFHFSIGVNDIRNAVVAIGKLLSSEGKPVQVPMLYSFMWIFASGASTVAAFISVVLAVPAFRYARFHANLIHLGEDGDETEATPKTPTWKKILLQLNFFMPIFIVLSFIPPLSSELITKEGLVLCNDGDWTRNCVDPANETIPQEHFWTEGQYYTARYYLLALSVLLRMGLYRTMMVNYLDSGLAIAQLMGSKTKSYSLSSIRNVLDVTAKLTCRVALQLAIPIVFWGSLVLLLNRWAGYSFGVQDAIAEYVDMGDMFPIAPSKSLLAKSWANAMASMYPDVERAKLEQALVTIKSKYLMRSVLSFFIWWSHLAWFVVSSLGYWYYSNQDYRQVTAEAYRVESKTAAKKKN